MADTDIGTQESGADEFAGINPDDVMALISGASEEINLPEAKQEAGSEQKPNNTVTMSAEEISALIERGISEGISKGSKSQPQQQSGQASDPDKFFKDYEANLVKSYAQKHGLNEEGAAFMASTTMEAVKPLVNMMAQGFQKMQQANSEIVNQNTLQDVDRNLNSWLSEKGVTDKSLQSDIIKLAKINTAEIPNADMQTLRAEFEKVASRYIRDSVDDEDRRLEEAQETRNGLPPAVKSGKIGFDDIVQKVARSSAKDDDIGGKRLLALTERMIRGGGV